MHSLKANHKQWRAHDFGLKGADLNRLFSFMSKPNIFIWILKGELMIFIEFFEVDHSLTGAAQPWSQVMQTTIYALVESKSQVMLANIEEPYSQALAIF